MNIDNYLSFLEGSASPFHVVQSVTKRLEESGFTKIRESQDWNIEPEKAYYFIRDQSCIVAFVTPSELGKDTPFSIVGTHTDSPTLKLKPETLISSEQCDLIPVEPYGSPIYESWFDRPLRFGGRVIIKDENGLHTKLIKTDKPVGVIPHLAIHMWPTRVTPPTMNLSTHIRVMLSSPECKDTKITKKHTVTLIHKQNETLLKLVINQLKKEHFLEEEKYDIISWDLEFSDTIKPTVIGDYLIGGRQDNLIHCFTAMESLIATKESGSNKTINMVAMFNNEEVGSNTREGAMSSIIGETIKRITSPLSVQLSFVLSADVSHGYHPNYPEESDPYSKSSMGKGICLKLDSRCGYSSSGALASVVLDMVNTNNREAEETDKKERTIHIQSVAKKNGTVGGSTIGPMTASGNHIRTCDVGIPLLAMHSICETACVSDVADAAKLFSVFFSSPLDTKFFDELD